MSETEATVKCAYCGKPAEPGRPVQLVAVGGPGVGDAEVVHLHQSCERGWLRLLDDPR